MKKNWRDVPGYEGLYQRSGISNTAAGRLTHYKGYKWKYIIIN